MIRNYKQLLFFFLISQSIVKSFFPIYNRGPIINKGLSKSITKYISSMLAGADNTGHNVLHANSELIHKILDSNLSFELKKELSLTCIRFAQFGDHTGHNILQFYHHFVDKYL